MFVPVSFHLAVYAVQHDVVPEVELASLVKQRSLYVLLQDVGFVRSIAVRLLGLQDAFDLVEVETDDDAVASIRVFARFDNPRIELMYRLRVVLVVFGDGIIMLEKL